MRDSSVTSGPASCAPPPVTIRMRLAAARRLAAAAIASSSIAGSGGGERRGGATGAALAPQVHRAFERRRSRAAGAHGAERVGDQGRGLGRRFDAGREVDNPRDDAGLVADLVQVAVAAADVGLRDLADQRQHRRVGAVGGEQRGRGVEQARPRHHGIGLRLAGRERGAERHVARALLVPRMDGADAVLGLEQGVEQVVVVHAGQRIDRVEAVRDQALDRRLRRCHPLHARPLHRDPS